MLAGDPANTAVLFGLAKEYEKAGDDAKLIETIERYLAAADDEGNAYGMLAAAYRRTKQIDKARTAYQRASKRHRHTVIQAWPKNTELSCKTNSETGVITLRGSDGIMRPVIVAPEPVVTSPGADTNHRHHERY